MAFAEATSTLLNPDLPCGEDLEYDPVFLALQQAALGKSEQQFGDTIIPAEPADWREVERLAQQLLERTRDVRILAYLTQAWTELRGLPGYAAGLGLIADTLERDWEPVHPRLEIDGEFDPLPRMNALASLCDTLGAARSVRSSRLFSGVHGQLTLRDAETVIEGGRAAEQIYPGGRERLTENLRQAWLQQAAEALAIDEARQTLRRIQSLVSGRIGDEWCPDFSGLLRSLDMVAQAWAGVETASAQPEPEPEPAPQDAAAAASPVAAPAVSLRWQDARILSREDAVLMLSKVSAYFETHEPSHPAPYLIRRTQQLISLSFHDILRNLAPQGLEQFEAWLPRNEAGGPDGGA
ncbi:MULTISPECIES: type VI secretion system protein TssA [unclassified Achromobacter]|uniref:type VI secretion system protein TssA n=1 Tax=unclassified Achromobacter TaxID=2626865 RepID=UPI00069CC19F|nr:MULTISPECIES: type VI secretion system protein TssA [unclassified Achromobacter]KOF53433.1 hypothetical protein AD428_13570 [Achromobacter sp. DMS1]